MRYYAFLRAINVGARRVTNDELLAPFAASGFDDAQAYQAAGNVTFLADPEDAATIEARVDGAWRDMFGFDTVVFVRTGDELRALVDERPFSADAVAATAGRIQLAFLRGRPEPAAVTEVEALVPADDRVVVGPGREWWWLPQEGISTSKLPVGAIESLIGPMTIRTRATVERMIARFGA